MDAVLPPLSGTVYGVILNDRDSLARFGPELEGIGCLVNTIVNDEQFIGPRGWTARTRMNRHLFSCEKVECREISRTEEEARAIEAGMIFVNGLNARDDLRHPFGVTKASAQTATAATTASRSSPRRRTCEPPKGITRFHARACETAKGEETP